MAISMEQMNNLYVNGLMGNLKSLASLMLSLPEFVAPLKNENDMARKYQLTLYFADSLFQEDLYKRAKHYYNEALQLKKALVKSQKTKTKNSKQLQNLTPEIEVKYKIYQCFMKQDNHRDGLAVLENIPPKSRTPKINMALGKLYKRYGMERSAITCFKEVLRTSPLALEAAVTLLKLGITVQELYSLISGGTSAGKSTIPEWMMLYLKGCSFATLNEQSKAIQNFKSIQTQLKDNTSILCHLGECYYINGDNQVAETYYEKVRLLDKNCLQGMDIYSQILASTSKEKDLGKLAKDLSEVSQSKTEPLIAMSYYCSCVNQNTKAIYFAQKAHTMDTSDLQAMKLKATLLKTLNKPQEAIIHFREAIRLAPNQLEAYEGLVECHTSMGRLKDAIMIARNARKTTGTNARTLTLCANVYNHDSNTREKAKTLLKTALTKHDASYLPAVYLLAEILIKNEQHEEASQILSKQLEMQETVKLYQMNGDCLRELGQTIESMEQYDKALRLDPENTQVMEAMHNLEKEDASGLDISSMQEPRDRSSLEGIDPIGADVRENPWMD